MKMVPFSFCLSGYSEYCSLVCIISNLLFNSYYVCLAYVPYFQCYELTFDILFYLCCIKSSFLHKSWFLYRGCGPEMTIIGTMTLRVTSCKAEWQEWRHVLDPRFESLYSESSFNLLNFLFSLANRFPLWFNKLGCDIMGCIAFLPNHNVDFLPLYTSECDYLVITEVIKVN